MLPVVVLEFEISMCMVTLSGEETVQPALFELLYVYGLFYKLSPS